MTDKYKHFNHHHELTDEHEFVDFGTGEFIANKKAIPLLKALNELGLITRTHHVDENGGFVGIVMGKNIEVTIRGIHERDAERSRFDGKNEILIQWSKNNAVPVNEAEKDRVMEVMAAALDFYRNGWESEHDDDGVVVGMKPTSEHRHKNTMIAGMACEEYAKLQGNSKP